MARDARSRAERPVEGPLFRALRRAERRVSGYGEVEAGRCAARLLARRSVLQRITSDLLADVSSCRRLNTSRFRHLEPNMVSARVSVKGTVREGFSLGSVSDKLKLPPAVSAGIVLIETSHKAK